MTEQVPDEPTLAEYEQYIRKQVAAEPYSTYARGVVRDLLAEVDRLRPIEQPAQNLVTINEPTTRRNETVKTDDLPPLAPGDAAWLLVLVQNAVPIVGNMDWEGAGRQHAYELLAAAAGATPRNCQCSLGEGHDGEHLPLSRSASDAMPSNQDGAA